MNLQETLDSMAGQLRTLAAEIPDLNVYPYMHDTPSPPALDIYPGTPFQNGAGMGVASKELFWTVRARVATADLESANRLLLRLLDPADAASVEAVLLDVDAVVVTDGVSGFTQYSDDNASERLIGCEWRVSTFV